jgi:thiamine biosynthesis lipoprotein
MILATKRLALGALLFPLCSAATFAADPATPFAAPAPVRRSQPLLGTFATITAFGAGRERVNDAITSAFDEFKRVDALMSEHRGDSEITRVNTRAAAEAVTVSSDLMRVLDAAQRIAVETDGAFDVTVRPLTDLWGFIWKEHRLPSADELQRALPLVGHGRLKLDARTSVVRFERVGMSLDLGGIAKGFAVDCAIERLRALGVTNAMVKAGGDLRVTGLPPGSDHWEVQIEDPTKEGRRALIRLRSGALSTSGNYENYFEVNGRRYAHILNPRTGMPVEGVASCTVLAPTCMETDAWATALFVLGPDEALRKFGSRFAMQFVIPHARGAGPWIVRSSRAFPAGN